MSFGKRIQPTLDQIMTTAEFARVVRLPREVGMWMARLDLGGGATAQTRETTAIDTFLKTATRKFESLPVLGGVIVASTVTPNPNAPLPETSLFTLCDDAITLLSTYAQPHEVNAYKLLLIEMAEAVARAGAETPSKWFRGKGPNVSRVEKDGINRLIDALHANDMVEKWAVGLPAFGPGVRAFTSPLTRIQQTAVK